MRIATLKQKVVDEDVIRKNLAHFRRNNPLWHNEIAPAFAPAIFSLQTTRKQNKVKQSVLLAVLISPHSRNLMPARDRHKGKRGTNGPKPKNRDCNFRGIKREIPRDQPRTGSRV